MRNFTKSILNYFAAFSETRFRFSRKLPYEWSEDSFTLDLSVFPDFQKLLLDSIAQGHPFHLDVHGGKYTVPLDSNEIKKNLLCTLQEELNQAYLQENINQILEKLREEFPDADPMELESKALSEGFREFNLAFRKEALQSLTAIQALKIENLQAKLGFHSVPPSSFNPQREIQKCYNDLQALFRDRNNPSGYVDEVSEYIQKQNFNFVMFDLHLVLRSYYQLLGAQSLYVFFHEIVKEDQRYPIFSVEIDIHDGDRAIVIETARDVIMLNTPAINNFEFDTVLTTPRACRFEDGGRTIPAIERFLQAKYNVTENFLLKDHFRPLVKDKLPTVRYRIGLQAVKEENRRILDYSELITSLDEGAGRKFSEMVSRYVGGNVENTSNEVQETYVKTYPRKSVERIIPKTMTVPLSLNETQKKILLSAENGKNQIIVVDGPPGTGKSYAITAIAYLANQLGKSVVVTSHKKQALDVIDQALTEQFKKLHPRSKPSVLRLEKARGPSGLNSLQNTLSSPVINAARSRSQQVNKEAVAKDRESLYKQIESTNSRFWDTAKDQSDEAQNVLEWNQELEALLGYIPEDPTDIPGRLPEGAVLDIERIQRLSTHLQASALSISLDALKDIFKDREELSGILEKCDQLNRISGSFQDDVFDKISSVPTGLDAFRKLVNEIFQCIAADIPLREMDVQGLSPKIFNDFNDSFSIPYDSLIKAKECLSCLVQLEGKLLGKFLKNKEINQARQALKLDFPEIHNQTEQAGSQPVLSGIDELIAHVDKIHEEQPFLLKDYILSGFQRCSPDDLKTLVERLSSLEFHPVVDLLVELAGRPFSAISLKEIIEKIDLLDSFNQYIVVRKTVSTFANRVGLSIEDLTKLYDTLKKVQTLIGYLEKEDIDALSILLRYYEPVLKQLEIDSSDISSLGLIGGDSEKYEHLLRFLKIHGKLSLHASSSPPVKAQIEEYLTKTRKLLDYQTDVRLSNLLNHTADVQRIQKAIETGKRISSDQTRVLLENLSCIIAEPELISQHFPMEADMIDFLVIDEASQVSIAESISLMLRAKQTIVFGDELQYGAVGAVNVSQRYSSHYFKDILRDYALDRNQAISEEETERIAREVSETPEEDDEESSSLFPVDAGTREWLKTFSVRTSTLAFAKALCNYSESLNVHFRSFPEIISYSNDFFYKEGQIELITNRIRTKPIKEVLRFIKVETKGMSGKNMNLDEIEAVQQDLEKVIDTGYKGSIGVICSFREQAARMEELFRKELQIYPDLVRNQRFKIWFVGDVQGEERDLIYYTFVQDKKIDNADLRTIYPIIGGAADNIRRLKMQRLNVGFSRAKDIMVFVHSMPIGDYADTRLGDALRHYENTLHAARDQYVEDESVFGSPAEKALYEMILQTPFFQENRDKLKLIAQFEIGKYIREEFHRYIPKYRVDFLLTITDGGKEKSLIIEYDGVEFHTRNPDIVTKHNFDQEYLEYDTERQLELESYGYSFLRINKFSLLPQGDHRTGIDVLNQLLERCFSN